MPSFPRSAPAIMTGLFIFTILIFVVQYRLYQPRAPLACISWVYAQPHYPHHQPRLAGCSLHRHSREYASLKSSPDHDGALASCWPGAHADTAPANDGRGCVFHFELPSRTTGPR
jgi:hypothetical protein